MSNRLQSLIGLLGLACLIAGCSDVTSPVPRQLPAAAALAKGAAGGGGGGGMAAPVVDITGTWNGTMTAPAGNCCVAPVTPMQLILTEDASGNLTGVAPFNRGALTGTAKSDGSFSAKNTEGFSMSGKATGLACADGSVGTALNGTLRLGIVGGAGFTGSFAVNNCTSAAPAP